MRELQLCEMFCVILEHLRTGQFLYLLVERCYVAVRSTQHREIKSTIRALSRPLMKRPVDYHGFDNFVPTSNFLFLSKSLRELRLIT